jgi:tRNA (guanine37-N1)-methyltransferase
LWLQKEFSDHVVRVSLGQFVTLGGELPAMTMTEAIVRLIPGVINTEMSWREESYSRDHNLENIEHPQYTRPEVVEDMQVPEVLLSGHHKKIEEWKKENSKIVKNL